MSKSPAVAITFGHYMRFVDAGVNLERHGGPEDVIAGKAV
jgi:hypothetical protein